jgi:hypothetical protein
MEVARTATLSLPSSEPTVGVELLSLNQLDREAEVRTTSSPPQIPMCSGDEAEDSGKYSGVNEEGGNDALQVHGTQETVACQSQLTCSEGTVRNTTLDVLRGGFLSGDTDRTVRDLRLEVERRLNLPSGSAKAIVRDTAIDFFSRTEHEGDGCDNVETEIRHQSPGTGSTLGEIASQSPPFTASVPLSQSLFNCDSSSSDESDYASVSQSNAHAERDTSPAVVEPASQQQLARRDDLSSSEDSNLSSSGPESDSDSLAELDRTKKRRAGTVKKRASKAGSAGGSRSSSKKLTKSLLRRGSDSDSSDSDQGGQSHERVRRSVKGGQRRRTAEDVAAEEKRAVLEQAVETEQDQKRREQIESLRHIDPEELRRKLEKEQNELLERIRGSANRRFMERYEQAKAEMALLREEEKVEQDRLAKQKAAHVARNAAASSDATVDATDLSGAAAVNEESSSEDEEDSLVVLPPPAKKLLDPAFAVELRAKAPKGLVVQPSPRSRPSRMVAMLQAKAPIAACRARDARSSLKRALRQRCFQQANSRWAKYSEYSDTRDMFRDQKYDEMVRREACRKSMMTEKLAHSANIEIESAAEHSEEENDDAHDEEAPEEEMEAKAQQVVISEELEGTFGDQATPQNRTAIIPAPSPAAISPETEISNLVLRPAASESCARVPQPSEGRTYGRRSRNEDAGMMMIDEVRKQIRTGVEDFELDSQAIAVEPESQIMEIEECAQSQRSLGEDLVLPESLREEYADELLKGCEGGERDAAMPATSLFGHIVAGLPRSSQALEESGTDLQGESTSVSPVKVACGVTSDDGVHAKDTEGIGEEEAGEKEESGLVHDRNAAYKAMLKADAKRIKKMKKLRRTGVMDDEAEEEEEEENVKGLGDYGFGVSTHIAAKEKDEDDYKAEKARPDDLDGIVDTYSDDEGDMEAADEFRKNQEAAEDKERTKELLRQVRGGFGDVRMGGRGGTARGVLRIDQLTAADPSNRREARRLGLANSDDDSSEDGGEESDDEMDELLQAQQLERDQKMRHLGFSEAVIQDLQDEEEEEEKAANGEGQVAAQGQTAELEEEERMVRQWNRKARMRRALSEIQEASRTEEASQEFSIDNDESSRDILALLQCTNNSRSVSKRFASDSYNGQLDEAETKLGFGLGMAAPVMKRSKSCGVETSHSGGDSNDATSSLPPPIVGFTGTFATRSSSTGMTVGSFLSRKRGAGPGQGHRTTITTSKFVFTSEDSDSQQAASHTYVAPADGFRGVKSAGSQRKCKPLVRKPSGRLWATLMATSEK